MQGKSACWLVTRMSTDEDHPPARSNGVTMAAYKRLHHETDDDHAPVA